MENRIFKRNKAGALAYIQMGIVILIMSALAVPIVFSVIGATNPSTIDDALQTALGEPAGYTPAANATAAVLTTTGTVLTLNPLAALVAVAAGMISMLVGAFVITTGRSGI